MRKYIFPLILVLGIACPDAIAAFSLACDAGKTTLRIKGTDSNVTWYDVANAGAGSVAVDGGGTEDPSFFVTEHIANGIYQVLKNVQFGDGTNTLMFHSKNESVYLNDGCSFTIKNHATLQLGDLEFFGYSGAFWSWEQPGEIIAPGSDLAYCNIYGSLASYRGSGTVEINGGNPRFFNSVISNTTGSATLVIGAEIWQSKINYNHFSYWANLVFNKAPYQNNKNWLHKMDVALKSDADITFNGINITQENSYQVYATGESAEIELKNPQFTIDVDKLYIDNASGSIQYSVSCSIHAVDKDGNDLSGVSVVCQDKDGNTVFNKTTEASGSFIPATVVYKRWEGTEKAETEYSPHKLTLTKPGYKTLVYKNITADEEIDWTIMMTEGSSLYGDLTYDNRVDVNDLRKFCKVWLVENRNNNISELDLDDDCIVNFYEYSFFAQNWLEKIE